MLCLELLLACGPRASSYYLAGIQQVFLKECYSQQFYLALIWGNLKNKIPIKHLYAFNEQRSQCPHFGSPCCKAVSLIVSQEW